MIAVTWCVLELLAEVTLEWLGICALGWRGERIRSAKEGVPIDEVLSPVGLAPEDDSGMAINKQSKVSKHVRGGRRSKLVDKNELLQILNATVCTDEHDKERKPLAYTKQHYDMLWEMERVTIVQPLQFMGKAEAIELTINERNSCKVGAYILAWQEDRRERSKNVEHILEEGCYVRQSCDLATGELNLHIVKLERCVQVDSEENGAKSSEKECTGLGRTRLKQWKTWRQQNGSQKQNVLGWTDNDKCYVMNASQHIGCDEDSVAASWVVFKVEVPSVGKKEDRSVSSRQSHVKLRANSDNRIPELTNYCNFSYSTIIQRLRSYMSVISARYPKTPGLKTEQDAVRVGALKANYVVFKDLYPDITTPFGIGVLMIDCKQILTEINTQSWSKDVSSIWNGWYWKNSNHFEFYKVIIAILTSFGFMQHLK
ncbi:hypothetical protein BDQ17DRAFT_1336237 [Cyathus striatus]|nr:hypothetical protein BDQ17DRAFT_1336237 [Cyathus striatus]